MRAAAAPFGGLMLRVLGFFFSGESDYGSLTAGNGGLSLNIGLLIWRAGTRPAARAPLYCGGVLILLDSDTTQVPGRGAIHAQ